MDQTLYKNLISQKLVENLLLCITNEETDMSETKWLDQTKKLNQCQS